MGHEPASGQGQGPECGLQTCNTGPGSAAVKRVRLARDVSLMSRLLLPDASMRSMRRLAGSGGVLASPSMIS